MKKYVYGYTIWRDDQVLSDYNTQESEIDANAFAMVILFNVLGIVPSFENLDQTAITKIKARAKEIKKELNRVNRPRKKGLETNTSPFYFK